MHLNAAEVAEDKYYGPENHFYVAKDPNNVPNKQFNVAEVAEDENYAPKKHCSVTEVA